MTITVGTPVKAQSLSDVSSLTLNNFVVSAPNQLLLVWVFHEGAYTLTDTSVSFGGIALTKVLEVKQTSGNQTGITVWALANPSVSTANIVATMNGPWNVTFQAMLIDGADLSGGLVSAVNATGAYQIGSTGTVVSASIHPTVPGSLILDAASLNDPTLSLTPSNDQVLIAGEQVTGGSGFSYKISQSVGGEATPRTLGYTASGTFLRASYGSLAIRSGAAPTLGDLYLTPITNNIVPGESWSADVSGRTTGSTVTASCPDETIVWNVLSNTLAATFVTAGLKVITLTETLSEATNSPHVSPVNQIEVLNRCKIGIIGSSTPAQWTGTTFNTSEVTTSRLRVWNGSTFGSFAAIVPAGKAPGGIAFGNYLLGKLGPSYRIDLVNVSLGGTALQNWSASEGPPNGNYAACLSALLLASGVDCIVCHLGSNDARAEQVPSRATFEGWYRTLIGNIRTELTRPTLPFFLMGCQRAPLEPTPGSDIYWARARSAEQTVAEDPNVHLGTTVVDLPLYADNTHLSEGNGGGNAVGARRTAHAVYNVLFGGSERFIGPKPGSASYNPATGWIRIGFSLAPGLSLVGRTGQENLTGYVFKAAGAASSPIVAPFVSGPAEVAARLATGLGSVSYSYQETANPDVSNCLFDNGLAPAQP